MNMIIPNRGRISLPLSPRGTPWRAPTDNIENFGLPVPGSLGSIIRQYKSSVTRIIAQQQGGVPHVWQRNYYEHIIRDEAEHNRIRRYIESNPVNWVTDDENIEQR
jgi:putative transposase